MRFRNSSNYFGRATDAQSADGTEARADQGFLTAHQPDLPGSRQGLQCELLASCSRWCSRDLLQRHQCKREEFQHRLQLFSRTSGL
jgi:hypothetical protein